MLRVYASAPGISSMLVLQQVGGAIARIQKAETP
jgi:hypothetical protein